MRPTDIAAAALVLIGGLNWGLVALAEFDLVAALTGNDLAQPDRLRRSRTRRRLRHRPSRRRQVGRAGPRLTTPYKRRQKCSS